VETENALDALSDNQTKEALHDLDAASTQLRIILSHNAGLRQVPVSFHEETFIYEGSPDDIKVRGLKCGLSVLRIAMISAMVRSGAGCWKL
jgi:hypothetical protein